MARMFVMSDNLAARVELIQDPATGEYTAFCVGCPTHRDAHADDLLHDTSERFSLADAERVAAIHADDCRYCADSDCRTDGAHLAGHRCRKD